MEPSRETSGQGVRSMEATGGPVSEEPKPRYDPYTPNNETEGTTQQKRISFSTWNREREFMTRREERPRRVVLEIPEREMSQRQDRERMNRTTKEKRRQKLLEYIMSESPATLDEVFEVLRNRIQEKEEGGQTQRVQSQDNDDAKRIARDIDVSMSNGILNIKIPQTCQCQEKNDILAKEMQYLRNTTGILYGYTTKLAGWLEQQQEQTTTE